MSCISLRAGLLAARDAREAVLNAALAEVGTGHSLIFASTAIPGPCKTPAGSDDLFRWALAELQTRLQPVRELAGGRDALGPYAILAVGLPAMTVKHTSIALETSHPSARLLDLDVYDAGGRRQGRAELSAPPRACLICDQPATDCMRLKRHAPEDLIDRAKHLLAEFTGAAAD